MENMIDITYDLAVKLAGTKSPEKAVKLCTEAGIPITVDQLETVMAAPTEEELDENDLDQVNGGCSRLSHAAVLQYVAKTIRRYF